MTRAPENTLDIMVEKAYNIWYGIGGYSREYLGSEALAKQVIELGDYLEAYMKEPTHISDASRATVARGWGYLYSIMNNLVQSQHTTEPTRYEKLRRWKTSAFDRSVGVFYSKFNDLARLDYTSPYAALRVKEMVTRLQYMGHEGWASLSRYQRSLIMDFIDIILKLREDRPRTTVQVHAGMGLVAVALLTLKRVAKVAEITLDAKKAREISRSVAGGVGGVGGRSARRHQLDDLRSEYDHLIDDSVANAAPASVAQLIPAIDIIPTKILTSQVLMQEVAQWVEASKLSKGLTFDNHREFFSVYVRYRATKPEVFLKALFLLEPVPLNKLDRFEYSKIPMKSTSAVFTFDGACITLRVKDLCLRDDARDVTLSHRVYTALVGLGNWGRGVSFEKGVRFYTQAASDPCAATRNFSFTLKTKLLLCPAVTVSATTAAITVVSGVKKHAMAKTLMHLLAVGLAMLHFPEIAQGGPKTKKGSLYTTARDLLIKAGVMTMSDSQVTLDIPADFPMPVATSV